MAKRITTQIGIGDVNPDATLHVRPINLDEVGVIVQGTAKGTQTADLEQWKNSAGTQVGEMSIDGYFESVRLSGSTIETPIANAVTVKSTTCTATTFQGATAGAGTVAVSDVKSTTCTATTFQGATAGAGTVNVSAVKSTTCTATTFQGATEGAGTVVVSSVKSTTCTATTFQGATEGAGTIAVSTVKSTTCTATGFTAGASGSVLFPTAMTPATSAAAGTKGMIAWDTAGYTGTLYVCVATDTWQKVATSGW